VALVFEHEYALSRGLIDKPIGTIPLDRNIGDGFQRLQIEHSHGLRIPARNETVPQFGRDRDTVHAVHPLNTSHGLIGVYVDYFHGNAVRYIKPASGFIDGEIILIPFTWKRNLVQ